jgi:Flp pilus assembly protein TadD
MRAATSNDVMSEMVDKLIERARRHKRRGETRKAIVALREACLRDDRAAWVWTMYGWWLAELGRASEAETALAHALWLRRQAKDDGRMRSTNTLLSRIRTAA